MFAFACIPNIKMIPGVVSHWFRETRGVAAIEAAFIFPIVISILMGVWDAGIGLAINQKVISASQVAADLITRDKKASDEDIDQALKAAELAMRPYDGSTMDYFIASIQFNDNDGTCPTGNDCPEVKAKVQEDISQSEVQGKIDSTQGLGANGEGLVMVVIRFQYDPAFSEVFTGPVTFQETAFRRGRVNSFVEFTS